MKYLPVLSAVFFTTALWAADSVPPASSQDSRQLLQQGLFEEEANRNLQRASEAYSAVLSAYEAQRNLASTALFRLASIRAKEGKTKEAIALFQRVVTEFPSDEALANLSRERLAQLGGEIPAAKASVASKVSAEEEAELVRLAAMVKDSPDLLNSAGDDNPVNIAANHGWIRAGTFLLDHGAKITREALGLAAQGGHKSFVELLLNHKANINQTDTNGLTALFKACKAGNQEVVRLLLDRQADPNLKAGDYTPLLRTIIDGQTDIVTLLLERGANPNLCGETSKNTPLTYAIEKKDHLVDTLLEHHADPNVFPPQGPTPLVAAISAGNKPLIEKLLSLHADPNLNSGTGKLSSLLAAICNNDTETVKKLIDAGAIVTTKLSDDSTPLHLAVLTNPAIVKLLLEHGASVSAKNNEGETPFYCSISGQVYWLRYLPNSNFPQPASSQPRRTVIRPGTSVSIPRPMGPIVSIDVTAPLTVAIPSLPLDLRRWTDSDDSQLAAKQNDQREIWKLLLAAGADINTKNNSGRTAFSTASYLGIDSLKWLIDHGVEFDRAAIGFFDWNIGLELKRCYYFPKWTADGSIQVMSLRQVPELEQPSYTPKSEFDAPPEASDILLSLSRNSLPSDLEFCVYRKQDSGEFEKVASAALSSDRENEIPLKLPILKWGDVVVLTAPDRSSQLLSSWLERWLAKHVEHPVRTVQVDIGTHTYSLQLTSRAMARDPNRRDTDDCMAAGKLQGPWILQEILSYVAERRPGVQWENVAVQRKVGNDLKEWKINIHPWAFSYVQKFGEPMAKMPNELLAQLQDGDHLVIHTRPANDPVALEERKSGIFRLTESGLFSELAFRKTKENPLPATLCEVITQAYDGRRILVPNPDLQHIVIHRQRVETGEEEKIPVDLLQTIRKSRESEPTREEAAKWDVPLEWGDMVEISSLPGDASQWQGFDSQTLLFLNRTLSRSADFVKSKADLAVNGSHPCDMHPIVNQFGRATLESGFYIWRIASRSNSTGFSILAWLETLGVPTDKVLSVTVKNGEAERRIGIDELRKQRIWAHDGDVITPETL